MRLAGLCILALLGLQLLGFAQRDADLIATAAAIRDVVGNHQQPA